MTINVIAMVLYRFVTINFSLIDISVRLLFLQNYHFIVVLVAVSATVVVLTAAAVFNPCFSFI